MDYCFCFSSCQFFRIKSVSRLEAESEKLKVSLFFGLHFSLLALHYSLLRYQGGYSVGDPPLPIPNREVKPDGADGTAAFVGE